MNELPVKLSCPLGHKCAEARDNVIYRCMWYTQMQGLNPATGDPVDAWRFAMSWLPVLLVENSGVNRGVAAATESLRNIVANGSVSPGPALLT